MDLEEERLGKVISEVLAKGYQLSPEALELLKKLEGFNLLEVVNRAIAQKIDKGLILELEDLKKVLPDWALVDLIEKPRGYEEKIEEDFEIIKDPTKSLTKVEGLEGFQSLFKSRYVKLIQIAKKYLRFESIASINQRDKTARVAGLLMEKEVRRKNAKIVLDDLDSSITLLALEDKTLQATSELLLDQLVVAEFEVSKNGNFIAKEFYSPDLEFRVSNFSSKEVYAILTSDMHVGSKAFLLEAFKRFLSWIKSDDYVARKVKYFVFAGDLVDGVGVYPKQEQGLEILDVREQISKAVELLKEIPKHIRIILIVGNHDPVRQALPQPALSKEYAHELYSMENVTLLGNPSQIRLHSVNLLIYHGQSLFDVVASIPNLSFSKPAKAMKVLLKVRHLAPSYGQRTPLAPEKEDHLVIEEIPDIFHSGHIHVIDSENYKGTLIVNSGAWQAKTIYQESMGIEPKPGIVPVVNLSNLEILTKDFVKVY